MAAALQNVGLTTVYCTPHLIRGTYEADNATVLTTLANLQARLQKENIAIKLFPGREHFMDEFLADYLKDPLPLGETRFILIEIPSNIPTEFVKETCFNVKRSGYVPMIAHPERCVLFAPAPSSWSRLKTLFHQPPAPSPPSSELLSYLKDIGCAFQGNLGSFSGLYGESVRRTAERLRADGHYTHYGTDLHSSNKKSVKLLKTKNSVFRTQP